MFTIICYIVVLWVTLIDLGDFITRLIHVLIKTNLIFWSIMTVVQVKSMAESTICR